MVTGAKAARTADDAVQVLQTSNQLQELIIAETGEFRPEITAHNGAGGFGDLHAQRCQGSNMLAAVTRILPADEQISVLEQFDLAADAGLGLPQTVGDGSLLDAWVPFEHH